MPQVRLDHVVIAVSDWERSNAFYRDVLGAEVVELDRGRYAYRIGGRQLNVHGPGTRRRSRARGRRSPGEQRPLLRVAGADRGAVEHLRRHGVEIEVGPDERTGARGRGTSVYFRDPDGSLLELISYG